VHDLAGISGKSVKDHPEARRIMALKALTMPEATKCRSSGGMFPSRLKPTGYQMLS